MKNILVPTDFSMAAENAFGFALDLASLHGSTIKILHVYRPEFGADESYFANEARFGGLEDAEKMLNSFVEEELLLAAVGDVQVKVKVEKEVAPGFPIEEILRQSQLPCTDLIVMGSTGEKVFWKNSLAVSPPTSPSGRNAPCYWCRKK